jgi:hypothetical protein
MPGVGLNPSSSNGLFRDSLAGRGLFPCRGCAEVFDSQASLVAHAELRHKSPPAAASSASISAAAAAELADKSFFVCGTDDCPEVFDNPEELRDHRQQSHSAATGERKSYACTYCSRVLYSYGGWKLHEMIHRGEKPLKCKYCPYNARSAANMHSHVQTRHKSRTSSTGNNVRVALHVSNMCVCCVICRTSLGLRELSPFCCHLLLMLSSPRFRVIC